MGENQVPTDFSGPQISASQQAEIIRSKTNNTLIVDPREYRPFAAKVNLSAHNIQGHLMKVLFLLIELFMAISINDLWQF